MTASWSGEQLDRISGSGELQIASRRTDGTLRSSLRSGASPETVTPLPLRNSSRPSCRGVAGGPEALCD